MADRQEVPSAAAGLDVEHGEITPSLKLKRPVVEREYKHLIDEMYAGTREA